MNLLLTAAVVGQISQPFIGVGVHRSEEILTFPVRHPVKFMLKCSFPARHPLVAIEKFGEDVKPFQPALNFVAASAGVITPLSVLLLRR